MQRRAGNFKIFIYTAKTRIRFSVNITFSWAEVTIHNKNPLKKDGSESVLSVGVFRSWNRLAGIVDA